MARKIQPNQIITYKKRIVYRKPQNQNKSFFQTFWGIFLINILIIIASTVTAGVGSTVVGALGMSQFAQAVTSVTLNSLVNFSMSTAFDAMEGSLTEKDILLNLLFSISDIGKLGRALKEDKLIKILNDSNLLTKIGFNQKIKNFYQLQKWMKLKNVTLNKVNKSGFKKLAKDEDLLQYIFSVADSTLKKEIKQLSYDQLKTLIEIERVVYQINPKLITQSKLFNLKRVDQMLQSKVNMHLNEFLAINDLEGSRILIQLMRKNVNSTVLHNLNLMRIQSKFQRSFFENFKATWKNIKNGIQKTNPFYWANELVWKMVEPIDNTLLEIKEMTGKIFDEIPKTIRKIIQDNGLTPCQPKSMFLAYSFEPLTIDGYGYLTIYKKSNQPKEKRGTKKFIPVQIWTNISKVKEFTLTDNQNKFYLKNWSLDEKKKNSSRILRNEKIKLEEFVSEFHQFYSEVNQLHLVLKNKKIRSIKLTNLIKENKLKIKHNFPEERQKISQIIMVK